MGTSIKIKEGGNARAFSTEKLKTALSDGGSCLWVPESSVPVISKSISQNGEYVAADEGKYGYYTLYVNGYGTQVVGKRQDGNTFRVFNTNGVGSPLEVELAPTEIRVTTKPTRSSYYGLEIIDYSGMVVQAYDSTGNLYNNPNYPQGIIPPNELILPNRYTNPNMDKVPPLNLIRRNDGTYFNSPIKLFNNKEEITSTWISVYPDAQTREKTLRFYDISDNAQVTGYDIQYNSFSQIRHVNLILASKINPIKNVRGEITGGRYGWEHKYYTGYWDINTVPVGGFTGQDESVTFYSSAIGVISYPDTEEDTITKDTELFPYNEGLVGIGAGYNGLTLLCYTLLYGDSAVYVKWPRPGDGKVLETYFTITVENGS